MDNLYVVEDRCGLGLPIVGYESFTTHIRP